VGQLPDRGVPMADAENRIIALDFRKMGDRAGWAGAERW
jgi:hypothetical protein